MGTMEEELIFVNHPSIRDIRDTEHLHRVRQFAARSRVRSPRIVGPKLPLPLEWENDIPVSKPGGPSQISEKSQIMGRKRKGPWKQAIGHPAINSVCSIPITLDADKHNMLEYFTLRWMPSESFIPPNCNIGGFTPLLPEDLKLSQHVVARALQASSELHIYALLAISACRMQVVSGIQPQQNTAKDFYTLKAVQALRKHLLMNQQITDPMILDLSFLAMSEFYRPAGTRMVIYWQMIKHFVIACGGFTSIDPFASFCIAADAMIAAATLTPPTFDFYRSPELLGLRIVNAEQQVNIKDTVISAVYHFEGRLRVVCLMSIWMAEFINMIHQLPLAVVSGITAIVKENGALLYKLLAMASVPRRNQSKNDGADQRAMTADGLAFHSRFLAYKIWTWHSSLSFLQDEIPSQITAVTNDTVAGWPSELRQGLERAQNMFSKTNWVMREDMVLWISALGILISTDAEDLVSYSNQFRRMATIIGIIDQDHLWKTLAAYPPLNRVQTDRWERLWLLLKRADHMP